MDVQAATQVWLGRLPAAARAAAAAHTHERLLVWTSSGLAVIAVCLVVHKLDLIGRLRRTLEGEGPRPWLVSAAAAGLLVALILAAHAPFDAFSAWRADQLFGVAPAPSLAARLVQTLRGIMPLAAAAIVLAPLAQALMRRRPAAWPWILGAIVAPLMIAVGWGPYALSAGPPLKLLPAGPLRDGLWRLVLDAHLPARQIFLCADPAMDLDVTGGFGRAVVLVGPQMTGAPVAEARAFAGHLMGHYAHGDILSIWVMTAGLTVLGFLAAQRLFRVAARLIGSPAVAGPAEPEALPILAIIAVVFIGLAAPLSNGFVQAVNVRADDFSLAHAREPDGLAAVLERRWDHENVDPPLIERALFYPHPPLKDRILHAMAWKADHGG